VEDRLCPEPLKCRIVGGGPFAVDVRGGDKGLGMFTDGKVLQKNGEQGGNRE